MAATAAWTWRRFGPCASDKLRSAQPSVACLRVQVSGHPLDPCWMFLIPHNFPACYCRLCGLGGFLLVRCGVLAVCGWAQLSEPPSTTVIPLIVLSANHNICYGGCVRHHAHATGMPAPARQRWQLLFNSDLHGKSFSAMTTRMCGRGATLVLVRDAVKIIGIKVVVVQIVGIKEVVVKITGINMSLGAVPLAGCSATGCVQCHWLWQ